MTSIATWLEDEFAEFDYELLALLHSAALKNGEVITPIMRAVSLLGEKGVTIFLWGLVCVLHQSAQDRTFEKESPCSMRKMGLGIWTAMGIGTVAGNFILKNWICRLRPMDANEVYRLWWEKTGAIAESGFSFPSGHVMAAAAGVTAALWLTENPKYAWLYLYVLLLAISRCYLLAHYPTDVIAGALLGVFSGIVAGVSINLLYRNRELFPRLSAHL